MKKVQIEDLLQFITENRLERMQTVLSQRTRYLTVVLENIYNPHNASAVLRSCEAFGVQDVHAIEISNKFEISRRVSQGSHNWLNLYRYNSSKQAVDNLHKKGYKVYFADPRPDYPDLANLPIDNKVALVFGQEKLGITDEMKEIADGGFRIPLYGFVESFNVSVACAISISQVTARIREAKPKSLLLTKEEQDALLNHWVIKNTLAGNVLKKNGRENEFLLKEDFLCS